MVIRHLVSHSCSENVNFRRNCYQKIAVPESRADRKTNQHIPVQRSLHKSGSIFRVSVHCSETVVETCTSTINHDLVNQEMNMARISISLVAALAVVILLVISTLVSPSGATPSPAAVPQPQQRPGGGAIGGQRKKGPSYGHHATLGHWSHHHARPGAKAAQMVRG